MLGTTCMAKPSGNVTGVSILATELDGKRIDLLKRMVPSAKRVGVLSDPSSAQAAPASNTDSAQCGAQSGRDYCASNIREIEEEQIQNTWPDVCF
jgi:putative tryptophan/tyrosine transport system substrate-binding protein